VVSSKSVTAVTHPAAGSIKPEYLAALSINPLTALRLLEDFETLNKGDVVIQNGANSMVGQCVLQLAKLKGVKTINIIREERPGYDQLVERMKQYGGYVVCSDKYMRTAPFRELIKDLPQPKLALNCTGGETVTEMSRLLAPGGTLVTYGGMSRRPVTVPTSALLFKDIKLRGFWLTAWNEKNADKRAQALDQLIGLVAEEKLRLWVERHNFSSLNLALARAEEPYKERKVMLSLQQ
jgi:trans-2-enoyl-CoA reductase